jgi:hypothetical protein
MGEGNGVLSAEQVNAFINDGFIKIENAFSTAIADECRSILWKATQCDPDNPKTWTQPVIRIGELANEPFKKAANTVILHQAFDQLAGRGNWIPRETLGSFPIRFPSKERATDTGWHVDASFRGENPGDYFQWRVNINSKGRALLMLFLFSDVSEQDGPTRIRIGSHLEVAKLLEAEGDQGLSAMSLAQKIDALAKRGEALATGRAGTVYLCHPFIVHAGQDIKGKNPKFMAQPALLTRNDFNIKRRREELCPVELAIVKGLD